MASVAKCTQLPSLPSLAPSPPSKLSLSLKVLGLGFEFSFRWLSIQRLVRLSVGQLPVMPPSTDSSIFLGLGTSPVNEGPTLLSHVPWSVPTSPGSASELF